MYVFHLTLDFKSGASTNSATLPVDLGEIIVTDTLNIYQKRKEKYCYQDLADAADNATFGFAKSIELARATA